MYIYIFLAIEINTEEEFQVKPPVCGRESTSGF